MKVLITASSNSQDAQVDSRFGRAPWFAVQDTETGQVEFVENSQNLNAMQGAGIQSGQTAVNLGVEAVVTGHLGPKAFHVLSSAGIELYQISNSTVKDAINKFAEGSLAKMASADKPGHW